MPKVKQKTRKSIAKRFRVTNSGKVLHARSFGSHLAASENSKRKRRLARIGKLEGRIAIKVRRAMGKSVGKIR